MVLLADASLLFYAENNYEEELNEFLGVFDADFDAKSECADSVATTATEVSTVLTVEGQSQCDSCCCCLNSLVEGSTAVVCSGLHTVCWDCYPKVYNASAQKCPLCRSALLQHDADHQYGETLPPPFNKMVEEARDNASKACVAEWHMMESIDSLRRTSATAPRHSCLQSSPDSVRNRGKKRTMAQYTADIESLDDPDERQYQFALRKYTQECEKLRVRVRRARLSCENNGVDYKYDRSYILAKANFDMFYETKTRPQRSEFKSVVHEI